MDRFQVEQYARLFVGRRSDFAIQGDNGRYRRAFQLLTLDTLTRHLGGAVTLATYVRDERGLCRFGVFDADQDNGLDVLAGVQRDLAHDGVSSYLERSRRGGHLWVLFAEQLLASDVRRWLLPYGPHGIEFYPKQDEGEGVGSLIRLPFGVHKLSDRRYPFVIVTQDGAITPIADKLGAMMAWLTEVERVQPPDVRPSEPERTNVPKHTHTIVSKNTPTEPGTEYSSIREWVGAQDALRIISRYVQLDRHGLGCCPFGEHHSDGRDSHPSFRAYQPRYVGASSWYCYAWQRGGNVFDFLCLYHGLDAFAMWHRIQSRDVWFA